MAQRLADEHGLRVYATDDAMSRHAALFPDQAPYLARFAAMTMDQRWLDRSPEVMLDTFHWFRGEGFDLVVDDLLLMPATPPVVAEGFRVPPHSVAPLLSDVRKGMALATRRSGAPRWTAGGPPWASRAGRASLLVLSTTCSRATACSRSVSVPRLDGWASTSWMSTSVRRGTSS